MVRLRGFAALVGFAFAGISPASAFDEAVRREEKPAPAPKKQPVLTKPPALEQFVDAEYPPEAFAAGQTASVALQVTIAADGSVSDAVVPSPVGDGFDEAAIAAVRQFRFSPAEVDGVPAPVQIEYVYHFTVQEKPAEPSADAPPPVSKLKGQLIQRGSRKRVSGAVVRCGEGEQNIPEAISDAEGRFTLETPAGTCRLRAIASGYRVYETDETLTAGETLEAVYYLVEDTGGYETVVRDRREKKEVVRRTLTRAELVKAPGTLGDPIRVIQNLPGLARAPFFSGALIVRGSSPQQTLTFIDGVDVPLLFHLGGGPSIVSSEFLERIDFYPGGFGARYGRAVGGVVDVETRKGASDTVHGSAKVDFFDAGGFIEAPVSDNVSIAAAARRSYIDALLPIVLTSDSLTVQPVYWDYQLRVDVGGKRGEAVEGSQYSVMAFGSDDRLKVVSAADDTTRGIEVGVHTLFHRVRGTWSWRQGKLSNTFTPYAGYDLISFDIGGINFTADRWRLGARENFRIDWSKYFVLRTGVDFLADHTVGTAELPILGENQYAPFPGAEPAVGSQRITRTFNTVDTALWAEADLKLGRFTLTPGVRASYARIVSQDRSAVEPRLWANYQLTDQTSVKGAVGLYTQLPDSSSFQAAPFGNPAISYERAMQTSVGFEHAFSEILSLDVTGYFNRRYDLLINSDALTEGPDGQLTPENFANDGLGRSYGLEVQLKHAVTKRFFGWVSYTFNRSELKSPNEPYLPATFDQSHILTTVGSYKLGAGWEVGARFRLVSGIPKRPLAGGADLYDGDRDQYFPRYGPALSARQPTFHQLDLRVEKSWTFTHWTFSTYLDVQNLYNAKNTEFTLNDYRYRREIALPGIPFLPVLGVRGSF